MLHFHLILMVIKPVIYWNIVGNLTFIDPFLISLCESTNLSKMLNYFKS